MKRYLKINMAIIVKNLRNNENILSQNIHKCKQQETYPLKIFMVKMMIIIIENTL